MLPYLGLFLANAWSYGLVTPNRHRVALHPLPLLGKLEKCRISYRLASGPPVHLGFRSISLVLSPSY